MAPSNRAPWLDTGLVSAYNMTGSLSFVHVRGSGAITNAGFTEVSSLGGADNWLTVAQAAPVRIRAGGNVADTAAGAGCQSIKIVFLDTDLAIQNATIVTAGASASAATSLSLFRLLSMKVQDAGTYGGLNAGNITLETTAGTAVGQIAAGIGRMHALRYTVPAGYKFVHRRTSLTCNNTVAFSPRLMERVDCTTATAPFGRTLVHEQREIGILAKFVSEQESPDIHDAGTDIWMTAKSSGAAFTATGGFDGDLIKL